MKNEADFKSKFKKSVRYYKGFSLSLAAPMLVGIPDLYVVIPEYIPVLLEAKWLGEIKRDVFKRKIPFTPMQENWLTECDNVSPYSAMGLVGFKYRDIYRAVLVKPGTPYFYELTNGFLDSCPNVIYDRKGTERSGASFSIFDVVSLFGQVPIPRICRKPNSPIAEIVHHIHSDINQSPPTLDGG